MPSDSTATENGSGGRIAAPIQMQESEIEALRQQCREILKASNLSVARLAAELNVTAVTFAAWLNGKYAGRNDQQGMLVRSGLQQRADREKVRAVAPAAPAFTMTPSAHEFMEIFAQAQQMPNIGVITGAPGIGKTVAACHYTRNTRGVWKITCSPTVAMPLAVQREFARALGLTNRMAPHEMHHVMVQKLRDTNGLLIVDEAQHLRPDAVDELRSLHDQAQVGLVFMGNEAVLGRMRGGNGTTPRPEFAQFSSRVGRRLTRKATREGDAAALLNASEIDDEDVREMLVAISVRPGALRTMAMTLRLARLIAARDQVALNAKHIEIADRNLHEEKMV